MKTQFFTIAIGERYAGYAKALADRLLTLNRESLRILNEEDLRKTRAGDPYWMKAYLWDLADDDTDQIAYIDADTWLAKPFESIPSSMFSAHIDIPCAQELDLRYGKQWKVKRYFNSGIFFAKRDVRLFFEQWKLCEHSKDQGYFHDQSWFNRMLNSMRVPVEVIPSPYIHALIEGPVPADATFVHYANRGQMLVRHIEKHYPDYVAPDRSSIDVTQSIYHGRHAHWDSDISFSRDGQFTRPGLSGGWWEQDGDILKLRWDGYKAETLHHSGGGLFLNNQTHLEIVK